MRALHHAVRLIPLHGDWLLCPRAKRRGHSYLSPCIQAETLILSAVVLTHFVPEEAIPVTAALRYPSLTVMAQRVIVRC